jgi:hypothetical protein
MVAFTTPDFGESGTGRRREMVRAASYRPKWDRVDHMNAGRQRALELRNQGITVTPHKSWEAAAKAQRQAQREAEKEWDNFDYWLAKVEARVRDIKSSYVPPHVQAARDEFAALAWEAWGEDVPF